MGNTVVTGAGVFFVADSETGRHLFKVDAAGNLSQALEGPFNGISNHIEFGGTTYAVIQDASYVSKLYAIDGSGTDDARQVKLITDTWAFTEFNGGLYFLGSYDEGYLRRLQPG